MKHLIPVALAALVVSAGPNQPATSQHHVKITDLDFTFEKTPQFRVEDEQKRPVKPRNWLVIEAEIEVQTTVRNKFIPELTATWHVVLEDAFENDPDKQAARLKGTVTYQHIRTHDKKAQLVAYIHPDTLEMLTGKDRLGRHEIRSVAVVLTGPDLSQAKNRKDGHSHAIGLAADARPRWWETWQRRSIDHAIIPLTKTPFLPIRADHYPQVKPD